MKKSFGVLASLVFATSIVSAQNALSYNLGQGMQQLIDIIEQMFGPFFFAILGGNGEMLFERILFLVIIVAIIYVVTSEMNLFKDNKPIIWIVSISVSLLSTRFLVGSDLIKTMLLPYSAFGIAITATLPLIIYFAFVESFSESKTTRKILWIFYIVTFIGIWNSRYNEVGSLSWIYLASSGVALILLLFDGTIRRAIVRHKFKELNSDNKGDSMTKIRKMIKELDENYSKGYIVSEDGYKRKRKKLAKQLRDIEKTKW